MRLRSSLALWAFGSLITFLVLAAALVAQDKKPEAAASNKEDATITADHIKSRFGKDVDVYTLTGGVTVTHQDTTLSADQAEYTFDKKKNNKTVVAEGNLKIVDPKNEITGAKIVVDLNERKAVVEGNVKLVAQPQSTDKDAKPATASLKLKEPTTVTCDKLEYLYRQKIATFSGNLKIVQKGRVLNGQQAVYDANQELATFTGGGNGRDEEGQTFTWKDTLKASFKEGDEWIETGPSTAVIKVDVDKETGAKESPEKPAEKK